MKKLRSNIMLIITALIWGSAFVAQDIASEYVQPFTFNALRSYIGGLFLIPIIYLFSIYDKKKKVKKEETGTKKDLITGGIACGTVLAISSAFQQFGIYAGASSGKAGFITAMYILIVPILGIFLKKKVGIKSWISVVLGIIGLYRLCITGDDLSILPSDFYLIICAFFFSVHILVIDHFSPKVNCIMMSCIQFFTCAIINTVLMLIL